ncbi:MAG: hypothetical protein U5P10_02490 [Spirochaetia bacterium]|nr:hypothetical protein [Spirochaetia bacterium]
MFGTSTWFSSRMVFGGIVHKAAAPSFARLVLRCIRACPGYGGRLSPERIATMLFQVLLIVELETEFVPVAQWTAGDLVGPYFGSKILGLFYKAHRFGPDLRVR